MPRGTERLCRAAFTLMRKVTDCPPPDDPGPVRTSYDPAPEARSFAAPVRPPMSCGGLIQKDAETQVGVYRRAFDDARGMATMAARNRRRQTPGDGGEQDRPVSARATVDEAVGLGGTMARPHRRCAFRAAMVGLRAAGVMVCRAGIVFRAWATLAMAA